MKRLFCFLVVIGMVTLGVSAARKTDEFTTCATSEIEHRQFCFVKIFLPIII